MDRTARPVLAQRPRSPRWVPPRGCGTRSRLAEEATRRHGSKAAEVPSGHRIVIRGTSARLLVVGRPSPRASGGSGRYLLTSCRGWEGRKEGAWRAVVAHEIARLGEAPLIDGWSFHALWPRVCGPGMAFATDREGRPPFSCRPARSSKNLSPARLLTHPDCEAHAY